MGWGMGGGGGGGGGRGGTVIMAFLYCELLVVEDSSQKNSAPRGPLWV